MKQDMELEREILSKLEKEYIIKAVVNVFIIATAEGVSNSILKAGGA